MSKRTIKQYNSRKQYSASKRYESRKTSPMMTVVGLATITGAGVILYNTFVHNPENDSTKTAEEHTCDSTSDCDHYHHGGGGFVYVGGGSGSAGYRSPTMSSYSRPAASPTVSRGFFGRIGGWVGG